MAAMLVVVMVLVCVCVCWWARAGDVCNECRHNNNNNIFSLSDAVLSSLEAASTCTHPSTRAHRKLRMESHLPC